MLTILAKDGRGEEVLQNLAVLLKRTFHFLPGHELVHLLGQLPEFLPNKARHQTLTASLMSQRSADVHSTNARKLRTADFLILHSLYTERVYASMVCIGMRPLLCLANSFLNSCATNRQ